MTTQEIKPKTRRSTRTIPLPDWVANELILKRAWYEKKRNEIIPFHDDDYICCRENGLPISRSHLGKHLHGLLAACELPDLHWHDLRHIYASTLKHSDINMKAVSEFLGHASPAFTEEVYITQKEIAYDCSILNEVWKEVKPTPERDGYADIPFTEKDLQSFLNVDSSDSEESEQN